jgi:hypothetical protein
VVSVQARPDACDDVDVVAGRCGQQRVENAVAVDIADTDGVEAEVSPALVLVIVRRMEPSSPEKRRRPVRPCWRPGRYSGRDGRELLSWLGADADAGLGPGRNAGDVNRDGHRDLIIGSYTSNAGATGAGRVQIRSRRVAGGRSVGRVGCREAARRWQTGVGVTTLGRSRRSSTSRRIQRRGDRK